MVNKRPVSIQSSHNSFIWESNCLFENPNSCSRGPRTTEHLGWRFVHPAFEWFLLRGKNWETSLMKAQTLWHSRLPHCYSGFPTTLRGLPTSWTWARRTARSLMTMYGRRMRMDSRPYFAQSAKCPHMEHFSAICLYALDLACSLRGLIDMQ